MQSTDEGLGIKGVPSSINTQSKLQHMVTEIHDEEMPRRKSQDLQVAFADDDPKSSELEAQADEDVPQPIDIPLYATINEIDGVIDVEVPFDDFTSPLQSPAIPGYHLGSSYGDSSFGASSFLSISAKEPDHPLNVGGWLEKLHPDFAVQAIKPYAELLKDVKAAMSAEPNPPSLALQAELGQTEKWFDICTSIIADTSTFTIKRLRLRRLVRFNRAPNLPTIFTPSPHHPLRPHHGIPYPPGNFHSSPAVSELTVEEEFEEEIIMDFDGTLADVIERVLAQSAPSSKAQSIASSRSSSRRGRQDDQLEDEQHEENGHHELPRTQCKRAIIEVLEDIAADVAKSRRRGRIEGEPRRSMDDINSTLRSGIKAWYDRVEAHRDLGFPTEDLDRIPSHRAKKRSDFTLMANIPTMLG